MALRPLMKPADSYRRSLVHRRRGRARRVELRAVLLATLAGVVPLVSCDRSAPTRPAPSVLLITIDTLRADHCSVQGYPRATTPELERFARDGTRIELAYAPTATTAPTHATIFTSLYPLAHGVRKNGMTLGAEHTTLAERLAAAGYQTAAVVSSFVLDPKFGFDQGFDRYDARFEGDTSSVRAPRWQDHEVDAFDQPANATTDKALAWLGRQREPGRPFFLFVHYFDPHHPYVPPEPLASRFVSPGAVSELEATTAAYDGEIAFADREIGRLLAGLEPLGLAADTLVVITGDHGEGLMQHGHMTHGVQIYEEAVRVPLLIRLQGRVGAGLVLGGPVELVDLVPTVLDLLELPQDAGLQGQSLAAALAGRAALDPERPVFLHRRHYEPGQVGGMPVAGEKFGIRVGPWKYIDGPEEGTRELFNLIDDPGERVNLFDPSRAELIDLATRLAHWRASAGDAAFVPPELSAEDIERLRALGYVQ